MTVICSSVLVFLIIAYVAINAIIGAINNAPTNTDTPLPEIDSELGEEIYGKYAIAYGTFDQDAVQEINIKYFAKDDEAEGGKVMKSYKMARPTKESEFVFEYKNSLGDEWRTYLPAISETNGFDYTDLYATESSSGYGIYKLSYLIVAVSVLYFDEKMQLPENPAEREKMLNRYGLGEEERQEITVHYYDKDGNLKWHTIYVGDLAIDGSGYYYMVDNRDVIYNSMGTNFDYALGGFEAFLHSRLTAEGLPMDAAREPYFTNSYKQWKNVIHRDDKNKSDTVAFGNTAIFSGIEEEYIYEDISLFTKEGLYTYEGRFSFKLDRTAPEKIRAALIGRPVGQLDSPTSFTIVGETNWALFGTEYNYKITGIEAILTDGADITQEGAAVGDARYIKINYDYHYFTSDNHQLGPYHAKAVVDLEKFDDVRKPDSELTEEQKTKKTALSDVIAAFEVLERASVGDLSELSAEDKEKLSFALEYTKETADPYELKYIIKDIKVIYESTENITYKEVIDEKSVVNLKYALSRGDTIIEEKNITVNLAEIDEDDGANYKIKEALIGKKLGNGQNIVAYTENLYREHFSDYRTYTVKDVEYFISEELVVSFGFVNASERNPFYGESLFENKLTDKNRVYALDSTACEYVVRLLGGISIDSSSTNSEGLVGIETVAVGLTERNMREYGLYANKIYFEIPRGIEDSEIKEGDYTFLDYLGFTLYISDINSDGTRYIASDMYDVVVKIDGSKFMFLDQSFVEFWARESLAMVSYEKIDKMTVDFNMTDLKGEYEFDVHHKDVWIINGEVIEVKPSTDTEKYDQIRLEVSLKDADEATDTLFKKELALSGAESLYLYKVYAKANGISGVPMYFNDTMDGANFKSALEVIFKTNYMGRFDSADEQQSIIKEENRLMSMSFTIEDENFSDTYHYSFYRADDRRIMVSIYKQGEKMDTVSDFYITPFAFKKIAGAFVSLLNGQTVNGDLGYQ